MELGNSTWAPKTSMLGLSVGEKRLVQYRSGLALRLRGATADAAMMMSHDLGRVARMLS